MDLMGIWGYVGLRITCRGMRDCGDMRDMRDGPPPRNHPGRAAVFGGRPPQSKKGGKWERKTTSDPKKRMLIFDLTCCLSII